MLSLFRAVHLATVAVSFVCALHCGPRRPSSVPLGRGPLAAEAKPSALPSRVPTATNVSHSPLPSKSSEPPHGTPEEPEPSETEPPRPTASNEEESTEIEGTYLGKDVTRVQMEGAPERTQEDPKAKTRVEMGAGDTVDFILVDSSDGHDICKLSGKLQGTRAEIEAGQSCFSQGGDAASTRGVVSRGKARIEGKRLELELELDFEIVVGDQISEGTMFYRFEGERR